MTGSSIYVAVLSESIHPRLTRELCRKSNNLKHELHTDKGKYSNLEHGGWIELQEFDLFPRSDDGTLTPEHPLMRWCSLLLEASEKFGRPYVDIPPLKDLLVEVGFVDVSLSLCKWPTNTWPKDPKYKEIGMWHGENVSGGLEGFTMAALTRALKWTPTEVEDFLVDVRDNIQDRTIHAWWPA